MIFIFTFKMNLVVTTMPYINHLTTPEKREFIREYTRMHNIPLYECHLQCLLDNRYDKHINITDNMIARLVFKMCINNRIPKHAKILTVTNPYKREYIYITIMDYNKISYKNRISGLYTDHINRLACVVERSRECLYDDDSDYDSGSYSDPEMNTRTYRMYEDDI